MNELKPCPFCGGEAAVTQDEDYPHRWNVRCTGCGVGDDGYKAAEWAAEVWNRRNQPDVERLVNLMDELIYAQDIAPDDSELYRAFMGAFGATLRQNLDQKAAKRAGLRALVLVALSPAPESSLTDPIAYAQLQNPD